MIGQFGASPFHGFIFETGVLVIIGSMTVIALRKYFQKGRNKPALLLFLVFLNWTIGVVFSWLAKIGSAFLGLDNVIITDFSTYFIRLILDFRLLFVFVAIALYCSYALRVMLFEKEYKKGERAMNIIFLVMIPVLCFVLETNDAINVLYTPIVFLLVFVYMLIVYSSFMRRALVQYRIANEKFKGAFKALAVMSLCFILTFLNFFLDQVVVAVASIEYTIFYFAAWICAVIAIVLTYYGYIKPRA